VIYGGPCANQHILPLARYLLADGRRRMLIIGSDYVFPREANRIMREAFEHSGGTVIGEHYAGFDADRSRFTEILKAEDSDPPDVIFSSLVGPSIPTLFEAYGALGWDPAATPIASINLAEHRYAAAEQRLFYGHLVATHYVGSAADAANRRFLGLLQWRYGRQARADAFMASSYSQIQMFAAAAALARSTATGAIVEALPEVDIESPEGPARFDAESHYTYLQPRIARVGETGDFMIVEEAAGAIKPDPYLLGYR